MANLLLLVVCFGAGMLLRRLPSTPADAHKALNGVIVNVSLPAMALAHLHRLQWSREVLAAIAMPWALFAVGLAGFAWLGRRLGWPRETVGALALVCGLGNTSFVGIPMLEALVGSQAIPLAILIDQAGSYLVIATLGTVAAAWFASRTGDVEWAALGRRVATFPPFVAVLLALALTPVEFPPALEAMLRRLADTVAPLALMSVGMQVTLRQTGSMAAPLCAGLAYKLAVAPALVLGAYLLGAGRVGPEAHIVVMEAAMGPSIGASILAAQHRLQPALVPLLVGLGIPLCLVTVPAWCGLLRAMHA